MAPFRLTALTAVGTATLVAATPVAASPRVAPNPHAVNVLVNKQVRLPAGFRPSRLVVPSVRFIFTGFHEKRQLRRDAAHALERLFRAARREGTALAAVSGYRSERTQRDLFDYHVGRLGVAQAERISARPGHSEHQTGLAIDVTGADGRCPASACFAGSRPARWLAAHAWRFGFIIRYPAGAEEVTGYAYEPWHLRYLGRRLAADVAASQLPYESYLKARRERADKSVYEATSAQPFRCYGVRRCRARKSTSPPTGRSATLKPSASRSAWRRSQPPAA